MGLMEERTACEVAVKDLIGMRARVMATLTDLYDSAPGYAGEVEAVKEAVDSAIKVLSGEPVE